MMLVPRRDFDLFDDFFKEPFFQTHESKVMKTDIKEHDDKFELLVDLPGYEKKDIKLHMEDGYLIVSAEMNTESKDEDNKGHFVRKERYYGSASRSFYVGDQITEEDIKANFKNGTLIIEVPKKEELPKSNEKKYIEIG